MKQPDVFYDKYTINNTTVHDLQSSFALGGYSMCENCVTATNPVERFKVKDSHRRQLPKKIEIIKQNEPVIHAHKQHHIRNHDKIGLTGTNYYQDVLLAAMDELSAATAGYLYGTELAHQGINMYSVASAMYGASDWLSNPNIMPDYVGACVDRVQLIMLGTLIDSEMNRYSLEYMQRIYKNFPGVLFKKDFYARIKDMFTYDGYCIMDDARMPPEVLNVWRTVQDNFQRIKKDCLTRNCAMIDRTIGFYF